MHRKMFFFNLAALLYQAEAYKQGKAVQEISLLERPCQIFYAAIPKPITEVPWTTQSLSCF